jgi:hypothetical protein
MKTNQATLLLSVSALVLLAANWHISRPPERLSPPSGRELHSQTPPHDVADHTPSGPPGGAPPGSQPATVSSAPQPTTQLNWARIETTDYREYVANLRGLGFPEELVHAIVRLDIEALYAPREALLRERAVPQDSALSQRQRLPTEEDWQRIFEWRGLLIEKKNALEQILGVYVPRDIITTPTSRNYDAQRYALDQLPPEKRDVIQLALENEWYQDDMVKHLDHHSYVEAYQQICDETKAVLTSVLTPEEYHRFWGNSTPAGTELARRAIGMEPTDEEFSAMFTIAWDHWLETGGVHGLWRARPLSSDQIAAADARMEAAFQELLGPDRYLDYQMATSEIGQQLRALADRYDLPRDIVSQVFQLEMEAERIAGSGHPAQPNASSSMQRADDLAQQAADILGPELWQAWLTGRNQRVNLHP